MGDRTQFWCNLWCGDMVLKKDCSAVYDLAHVKDASLADNLEMSGIDIYWNVKLRQSGTRLGAMLSVSSLICYISLE